MEILIVVVPHSQDK